MAYRLTPHSTTGVSPAELLLGKQPRTRLDLLKPNITERVENQQIKQKKQHDVKAKERIFEVGDEVLVRNNHRKGELWLAGAIRQKTGPVSFVVDLADGREQRFHQDHLRRRYSLSEASKLLDDVLSETLWLLKKLFLRLFLVLLWKVILGRVVHHRERNQYCQR